MPRTRPIFINSEPTSDAGEVLQTLKSLDRKLDSVMKENEILRNQLSVAIGNLSHDQKNYILVCGVIVIILLVQFDNTYRTIKEDYKRLKKLSTEMSSDIDLQHEEAEQENNYIQLKWLEDYNYNKDWKTLRRYLEFILEQGSTAHKQLRHVNKDCTGPLYTVGRLGLLELARHLLKGNVLLEFNDLNQGTMLHGAARAGDLQLVKLLLRRGANVDARNKSESTPLMFAADRGHVDVVMCLMRAGADTSTRNIHGLSAFDYAKESGHAAVMQFLHTY